MFRRVIDFPPSPRASAAFEISFGLPREQKTTALALCGSQGLAGLSKPHRPTLTLTAAPGRGSHQSNRLRELTEPSRSSLCPTRFREPTSASSADQVAAVVNTPLPA